MRFCSKILALSWVLYAFSSSFAESKASLTVAVATNFLSTAQELSQAFEAESDTRVTLVSGSSGNLYAQIKNGAPYDVFLSADQAKINAIIDAKLGQEDSRMTYARGRLCYVLNPNLDYEQLPQESFESLDFKRIVIANPKLAPYGVAVEEVVASLSIKLAFERKKVILADNVGKSYAIVRSGNVDAGMVALSSILDDKLSSDYYYIIPENLHNPLKQDAIVLSTTSHITAAKEFLIFLQSTEAQSLIEANGYAVN